MNRFTVHSSSKCTFYKFIRTIELSNQCSVRRSVVKHIPLLMEGKYFTRLPLSQFMAFESSITEIVLGKFPIEWSCATRIRIPAENVEKIYACVVCD